MKHKPSDPVPDPAVPKSTVPKSTVPKSTVPESAVPESAVPESKSLALDVTLADVALNKPQDVALNKPQDVDALVKHTLGILRQGMHNAKQSVKEIMEGALHLKNLNLRHSAQGARNDIVPDGKKSGFGRVLQELHIPPTTAYRWMAKAEGFILELGITDENFPMPNTVEWVRMVKSVKNRIEHLTALGLPVSPLPVPKDEKILTILRAAAAAGDDLSKELLQALDAGEIEIEDATQRYCQKEKPAKRPAPALLKLNSKTLELEGMVIKALKTLEEFFLVWDQLPLKLQVPARARIRETMTKLPPDCKFHDN